jgi:tetratricopeptide (TPR) repeat protein
MLVRLANPAARSALIVIALVLATTLSYSSLRNALAAYDAGLETRQGYERATRLEPSNAQNWYLLGRYWQYQLEDLDAARAVQAYRTALSLNPQSGSMWLDLAATYESQNDEPAARQAFLEAQRVYPASPEVSWRYGNFLLRQNELPAAFAEIRNAVAVDPKRAAEAVSRCWRVDPDIQAILDQALPPSAPVYLAAIRELDTDAAIDPALAVWDRLVSLHPRLPLSDAIPFTDSLIQAQRIDDAHRVWDQALTFVDPPVSPPNSVLWDGGFETGVTGGGFTWVFAPPLPGVEASFDSNEKHSGQHSLRLVFDGRRNVDFDGICQFAQVQPGSSYLFSAWVQTQTLTTDQGVRFRLEWLENGRVASAETTDLHGTQPWTQLSLPWTAVAGVRQLRLCVNRHPSGDFSSRIHGTAWVDDVALIRVPEPATSPKR